MNYDHDAKFGSEIYVHKYLLQNINGFKQKENKESKDALVSES